MPKGSMRVELFLEGLEMIELPEPIREVLERIVEGEFLLVEYNTLSNIDLLPFKLTSIGKSVFVEIGDRLHVKLHALLRAHSDLAEAIKRTPIISVSNFYLSVPGFNIVNVPLNEISMIISKFYSFMKDKNERELLIICGMEQIALHFDVMSFMKELAGLKVALPSVTFIGFLNYNAIDTKTLATFESMATSVVRIEGEVDKEGKRIRRYIYALKSINPVKYEVLELNHEI